MTRWAADEQGFPPSLDRRRRLHLVLDAYGYDGDRSAFAGAVIGRTTRHAEVIRQLAADGNPVFVAMLPVAENFDRAAREITELPAEFWVSPPRR
jgi:hypothetical protein